MKIITLNTWGGIAGTQGLLDFFKTHENTDIFCLQEIFNGGKDDEAEMQVQMENKEYNLFNLISEVLPNHTGFFRPHIKEFYGLAMFVKKDITLVEEGEEFVHRYKGYVPTENLGFHARNIEYVKIMKDGKELCVINFHGLWNGKGKTDTDQRLEQSKNILRFTSTLTTDFVLCGDFNLLPSTESLKLIEDAGLRNLIKENGVTSTRTSHYTKPDKFADYIFTSQGIEVKEFKVLPDEVSDHAPLYIVYIEI
jgi:endonuclease/exonuclease/phosphatase family metal-dependent hydrolase